MKFFCEYCGNRIDAEKDNKCPNCGASYKKNKTFVKLEEEKIKQSEINNENKQKVFNHVLGTLKFSRWFLLIPVVMFVVVLIIMVSIFSNVGKSVKSQIENNKDNEVEIKEEMENVYDNLFNSEEEEQEYITVNFDEYAVTNDYKVKVNKYEVEEDIFKKTESGYQIVKFHLLVENLTEKEIDSEDVNCIVDGIAQNNYYYSGHSDLPFRISKGLTVKGTSTFIVPTNATSYDIRYGDYVTIHIEK